jgi:putative membrane protein
VGHKDLRLAQRVSETVSTATAAAPRGWTIGGLIERILLIVGIGVVFVLLYELGVAAVWENVSMVGWWGFVLILGLEAIAIVFNAKGWQWAFPHPHRATAPFRSVLAARLAGDAINVLTPTATVGGEVVRARMLEGRVDMTSVWASVAIAKLTQALSQILLVVGGFAIILDDIPLPDGLRQGLFTFLVLIGTGLAIALIMQWRGRFASALGFVEHLGLRLPAGLAVQLNRLDADISRFYATPGPFLWSTIYFLAGWLISIVEIYLIMLFLGMGGDWYRALIIEVLTLSIETALFFVPGQVGTQEGGKVLIFSIMGLPPAKGLALGIVRRVRQISWSVVGLIALSHHQARASALRRSRTSSDTSALGERAA